MMLILGLIIGTLVLGRWMAIFYLMFLAVVAYDELYYLGRRR